MTAAVINMLIYQTYPVYEDTEQMRVTLLRKERYIKLEMSDEIIRKRESEFESLLTKVDILACKSK